MSRYEQFAEQPPRRASRASRQVSLDEQDHAIEADEEDEPLTRVVPRSAIRTPDVPRRAIATQRSRDLVVHRVPRRASAFAERETEALPRVRRRTHPLLFLGVGMLVLLLGYVLLTSLFAWVGETSDTLHYGFPRPRGGRRCRSP